MEYVLRHQTLTPEMLKRVEEKEAAEALAKQQQHAVPLQANIAKEDPNRWRPSRV